MPLSSLNSFPEVNELISSPSSKSVSTIFNPITLTFYSKQKSYISSKIIGYKSHFIQAWFAISLKPQTGNADCTLQETVNR